MKLRCVRMILLAVMVLGLPLRGWAETPTDTVKSLVEAVRAYKKDAVSAQDKATNAQVQKVVEEALALPDLAKRVLGPQWEKLPPSEQKNFRQLLVDLLQKIAYPKSAEFFSDLQVNYGGEKMKGTEAVVETQMHHPQEGQVTIEYHLNQKDAHWVITDILLDDVSLITSVRSQMQQVINKESYQGLVKRMREKLTES